MTPAMTPYCRNFYADETSEITLKFDGGHWESAVLIINN